MSLLIVLITDRQIWYVCVGLLIIYKYTIMTLQVTNLVATATVYMIYFMKKNEEK